MLWWVFFKNGSHQTFEAAADRIVAGLNAQSAWGFAVHHIQSDADRTQEQEERDIADRHLRMGWRSEVEDEDGEDGG
jgi:hypothetical protein